MKHRKFLFGLCGATLATTLGAVGCVGRPGHLPPSQMMMHPGPGVDGPGPGVVGGPEEGFATGRTSQILFAGPDSMQVAWDVGQVGSFDSEPLVTPGRYNFPQGGLYRLKLTSIPDREGEELYPTLEVAPATPRSEAFLAHNAVPIQFSEEDFEQVRTGNFVTKVIYLPDPEFQELALAGVETLVSTRLDPGVDPIVEADRRGAILAVLRLGNKDLTTPGGGDDVGLAAGMAGIGGMSGGGAGDGCDVFASCAAGGAAGAAGASPISGVSAPEWGMAISGTPIGLPGPPHVPLGVPAGLQKHVVKNHTRMHIPGPSKKQVIHVKQMPGYRYPAPANHAFILERNVDPEGSHLKKLGGLLHHKHAADCSCSECQ